MEKIKKLLILVIVTVTMISCGTTYTLSEKNLLKIQPGMSKENVSNVLGHPNLRRFDTSVEEWEYVYSPILGDDKIIIVKFQNGKVVGMDSFLKPTSPSSTNTNVGNN
jgi:outer membrane protein assembly factor BamE (lipoprotein component of BamABCDE complex)